MIRQGTHYFSLNLLTFMSHAEHHSLFHSATRGGGILTDRKVIWKYLCVPLYTHAHVCFLLHGLLFYC